MICSVKIAQSQIFYGTKVEVGMRKNGEYYSPLGKRDEKFRISFSLPSKKIFIESNDIEMTVDNAEEISSGGGESVYTGCFNFDDAKEKDKSPYCNCYVYRNEKYIILKRVGIETTFYLK